mgnify:CR=1 FL=1|tara:strand:- start:1949 stop:3874 length:1926 start_codon:yes stop_codon:yes gene_type:complete
MPDIRKKKILFHSNHSKALTGFGKNTKNILKYLHSTKKYEIIEACNGLQKSNPSLSVLPWKCVGTLPDEQYKIEKINQDKGLARSAGYGSETIDEIIKEFKPDIYIGAEDIWAFNGYWDRSWWPKINSCIWTTLDSLPILPLAVKAAPKIKNFFSWSSFAEEEMKRIDINHVKTLHGPVDCSNFSKLSKEKRNELRSENKIGEDFFVIGFVFRNQLRKSVPNLIDGFKKFQENFPQASARLFLHTNWLEGWNIPSLIREKKIDPSLILTTYYCSSCKSYHIAPFTSAKKDCPKCLSKQTCSTPTVTAGVNESQLNEIYNIMDVYCHPFTSGGQEIPIQEAKLCELITLVTDYSCGKDHCTPQSGGLPLSWAEYREPGTQFIKASTDPNSIFKNLKKVYEMPVSKKEKIGKKSRKFIEDNYSIDVIGDQLEKILDNFDLVDWDFDFSEEKRNPDYRPKDNQDDNDWLIDIYKNILKVDLTSSDDGHKYWMQMLAKKTPRSKVLEYFTKVAKDENKKIEKSGVKFEDFLSEEKKEERVAVLIDGGEENALCINMLLEGLQEQHPSDKIYVISPPDLFDLIEDNPYVHRMIPFTDSMKNIKFLEGSGSHKGFFKVAYIPDSNESYGILYHNGHHRNEFNLYENI